MTGYDSSMNRRSTDQNYTALVVSVDELKADQQELHAELSENSEMTRQLQAATAEMVEMFNAAKGAFKVLGWIGTGVKWAGGIAAGAAALWALLHGPWPPK